MGQYNNLLNLINQNIRQNGQGDITGTILNTVLTSMVTSLAQGFLFKGVATPSTTPGTPDQNVFWLAGQGVFQNFGSTVRVPNGYIAIFTYNGSFSHTILPASGILDVSSLNMDASTSVPVEYASLAECLGAIPSSFQHGGMTIQYISSCSHTYEKYTLISSSWTTDVSKWRGVVNSAIPDSDSLITSGGVADLGYIFDGCSEYVQVIMDAQKRMLEACDNLGSFHFFNRLFAESGIFTNIMSNLLMTKSVETAKTEFMQLLKDNANHIIQYIRTNGIAGFPAGIEMGNSIAVRRALLYSKWHGKRLVALGDSITEYGTYLEPLGKSLGTITYNRGSSGTCVADSDITNSFCSRVDLAADEKLDDYNYGLPRNADIVIIEGGINDWGRLRSQVLGSISDAFNRQTFAGAYMYVCKAIREKYPKAEVYCLNLHGVYSPYAFTDWHEITFNNSSDETKGFSYCTNNSGKTLENYREIIRQAASFYGFKVIELKHSIMQFTSKTNRDNYSRLYQNTNNPDGLHPNTLGGELLAQYIMDHLSIY